MVLGRLFKTRSNPVSVAALDPLVRDKLVYVGNLQQRAADYAERRAAILIAGGADLDHRPRDTDKWEAAIQRLVREGALREDIEYRAFGQSRTYRYSLTAAGESAVTDARAAAGGAL